MWTVSGFAAPAFRPRGMEFSTSSTMGFDGVGAGTARAGAEARAWTVISWEISVLAFAGSAADAVIARMAARKAFSMSLTS